MRKVSDVWKWCIDILLISGCGTETPVQPTDQRPASAQSEPAVSPETITPPVVDASHSDAEPSPSTAAGAESYTESTQPSAGSETVSEQKVDSTAGEESMTARAYQIAPSKNVQFELQARLIEAVPGDVIQLDAGRYVLNRQFDAVADNLTIRGQGGDQTVLTFKGQTAGGQGLEAIGNNFTLENLAIEDTAGNSVKILGANNDTLRGVRVEWTGEPSSSNGAYGLYPVPCENVLIENCTSIGASDAGIYVGQCRNVVVRSCHAERNVAGIEIENTVDADVYENVATHNTGGISGI